MQVLTATTDRIPLNLPRPPEGEEIDMKENRVLLTKLKRWPTLKRHLEGKFVRIFSYEHGCYWRQNSAGYTYRLEAAGIYTFDEAFKTTHSCGPEKGISFEVAESEYSI